jgi:putative tryptophan/tyrosine transport system substrate-binding protein
MSIGRARSIQESGAHDSIAARRWHAADFFNSIGQTRTAVQRPNVGFRRLRNMPPPEVYSAMCHNPTIPGSRNARVAHMRFNSLRRREFITLLGGAAAWPLTARAQTPPKPARLGYIWIGSKGSEHSTLDGIRQGLHELGYAEGRDFILEDRYADSQPERLPAIVAELLRLKVDLLLSPGNPVTRAAMQATSTIPIIATTPDLLESGFVASLARPGGNVTGISLTAGATLSEKWLELLKETFPNVTKVAVLSNLTSASSAYLDRMRTVASVLGVQPQYFAAQNPTELDRALAEITVMMPDGLVVESDATLVSNRTKIIAFAAQHRLPTVYGNLDYIPDGGLMAYYTSIVDAWRRLATYVDKVLKGVKPSDLPVQQATKFELVINLKTANALGLTVSPMILIRADEVIE